MDKARIEKAVREILIAIGEDPDREGLVETPKRVANMYEEIFAGLDSDPHRLLKVFDEGDNDEMVVVRDIPMYSMCEHHLLPFYRQSSYRIYSGRRKGDRTFKACKDCFGFC